MQYINMDDTFAKSVLCEKILLHESYPDYPYKHTITNTSIKSQFNRIYRHFVQGQGNPPRVSKIWSPRRGLPSRGSCISLTRGWISLSLYKGMVDYFSPIPFNSCKKSRQKLQQIVFSYHKTAPTWRRVIVNVMTSLPFCPQRGNWRQPVGDKLLNFIKTYGHTCLG